MIIDPADPVITAYDFAAEVTTGSTIYPISIECQAVSLGSWKKEIHKKFMKRWFHTMQNTAQFVVFATQRGYICQVNNDELSVCYSTPSIALRA
jgi:hypothetical protein